MLDLIEKVKENVPTSIRLESENDEIMKLAIVGKPNVGKSTLLNSLFGDCLLYTSPSPRD